MIVWWTNGRETLARHIYTAWVNCYLLWWPRLLTLIVFVYQITFNWHSSFISFHLTPLRRSSKQQPKKKHRQSSRATMRLIKDERRMLHIVEQRIQKSSCRLKKCKTELHQASLMGLCITLCLFWKHLISEIPGMNIAGIEYLVFKASYAHKLERFFLFVQGFSQVDK